MKNKGFTLVELLAVIVILGIIMLIATPLIINVISDARKGVFKNSAYGLVKTGENEYMLNQLNGETKNLIYEFSDGEIVNGQKFDFKGKPPKGGSIIIRWDGKVAMAIYDEKWCAIKNYENNEVDIIKYKADGSCKLPEFVDTSGANAPLLVSGMTPIKWDGTNWVEPQNIDDPYKQDWYNYGEKKWANAKTKDGSYWVWIPRYAYSITNGYHTSTTGNIDVKFLENKTNITKDGTMISTLPTYVGDKQTNYVKHPAFDFDGEISGFWIAKFEPSVANQNDSCYIDSNKTNCNKFTLTPKFIPNAVSWRNIEFDMSFVVSLNMKNNSVYGWKSEDVDTHLIKNTEWGAVAYLSHSKYGANDYVMFNNTKDYITGCAASEKNAEIDNCINPYNTIKGELASTTHNIYGVYDMSGGAWERSSSYVDNGNNPLGGDPKYKNVYAIGTTDTSFDNYNANKDKFGDSVYETSAYDEGFNHGWYISNPVMPRLTSNFFLRGGYNSPAPSYNIFSYHANNYIESAISFRPIVIPLRNL